MVCVRCKKRTAVVFIQRMDNGKPVQEGYCLTCAREMHIQPVDDLMKQFGMSDQDLENMEERMSSFLQEAAESGMLPTAAGEDAPEEGDSQDDFVPGGSPVFPFGFGAARQSGDDKAKGKNGKKDKAPKRKFLDTYCENLTQKARDGKVDRIIGRDREIYRTIQILCRRQKNNPCLIGEAGVGKTAIAEGIAQRIAEGQVPARLRDKEIFLLDMTALIAGTQFRGQFEQRVKGLISEVKAAGNIILFIDEIHSIVGAGDSDGAMNAANIMKPALSRGQVQVIGATTFAEYRKYIEKDTALERRFQPVKVEEPSISDTIEVLKGIRIYYEKHHCVRVPDPVVTNVVKLSERYITDRFLPDKAIDLLDEACACCNLRHPEITELVETQRSVAELESREHELENPEPENGQDAAIDYEALASVKTELAQQRQKLPALQLKVAEIEVTMDDVAQVIELWTGIPAVKIKETEYGRLQGLEEALKEHIIGQDQAVHAVAGAIKRARADLSGRHRPACFIFVGPTGVGKTELVTNVSHDLKTPLTAIITYVNLLKQENITDEERNSYIQILDQKSMRLKELIEDLFEVSKAANGTVVLHPEEVDVVSLLKQVHFELSDKIEASGIQFHFDLPNERLAASLDGQKTCRIFENLLVNITKYGMKGTRAYIKAEKDGEYVQVTLRNISAEELKISPEELTERFVRGDASRNTEGSGLGLAIARSFTEVQGGTMKIEVEGDLFRVILRWKLKDGSEEPEETIQEGSVQEKLVQEEPEADDLDTSDQ